MKKVDPILLRIGAFAAAVALLAGLLWVRLRKTPQGQANSAALELAQSSTGVSGVFRGEASGYHGMVTVTLTLTNGVITDAKADGPGETEGIGSVACRELPVQMVTHQTINVDQLSGATLTSTAIRQGAEAALTAAGVELARYQSAVQHAAGEDIRRSCDIVVVGAGGAGMTAAIQAAQAGRQVILVESQAMVGGNSVRATGGMNAAGTPAQQANVFQESAGVESTLAAAAQAYADHPAITGLANAVRAQWQAYQADPQGYFDSPELMALDTLIGGKGRNDPALVQVLCGNSADAVAWLAQLGCVLDNAGAAGGASVKRITRPTDEAGKVLSVGAYMIPILQRSCQELGVELMLNTRATSILTDETGAAAGILATQSDGTAVELQAGAVVLATGGFGADLEMVASYRPELEGFVSTNAAGILGDGIRMATAIGAGTVDMDQIQIHPTVEYHSGALITEGLRGDGAILVNAEGQRFVDEVSTRDVVSAAEIAQSGGYAWLILDQRMADASGVIQDYIASGYTVSGATVSALAQAMGVDGTALAGTLARWNSAVTQGQDPDFGRTALAQPLDAAPYYAIRVHPGIHHTMGGLTIDAEARVLDQRGKVLPGLFAAGEVTGGVHGANRLGGTAVTDFVVFGRVAGQSACDYLAQR